ncbi:hypothetical protein GQ42DRAFT_162985 [Ramicandelaber brevisporus]|nr:hypothetical protein GQ42DRAFT_162985 [Ramicandelaber brevisporus]
MAKSIRSKIKRKFRNIKRDAIFGPVEAARLQKLVESNLSIDGGSEETAAASDEPQFETQIGSQHIPKAKSVHNSYFGHLPGGGTNGHGGHVFAGKRPSTAIPKHIRLGLPAPGSRVGKKTESMDIERTDSAAADDGFVDEGVVEEERMDVDAENSSGRLYKAGKKNKFKHQKDTIVRIKKGRITKTKKFRW